jgi:TonB family protein
MRMGRSGLLLAFLVLFAGSTCAQQELAPSTEDGPMNIKPGQPTPDKDGVYRMGPGIVPPILTHPKAAVNSSGDTGTDHPGICILSTVIAIDGTPTNIQMYGFRDSSHNEASIEAVKQSQFEPGTLDGKPVPVLVYVRIPFLHIAPPIPSILPRYPQARGFSSFQGENGWSSRPLQPLPYDKPPVAIFAPAAEFSAQARAAKYNAIVLISVLVTEDGLPTDAKVLRPAGMGLDETAMEAVSRYRFKPATKDGVPIAARITVEINFRLQ